MRLDVQARDFVPVIYGNIRPRDIAHERQRNNEKEYSHTLGPPCPRFNTDPEKVNPGSFSPIYYRPHETRKTHKNKKTYVRGSRPIRADLDTLFQIGEPRKLSLKISVNTA
jgi:hypothetical protein